MNSGRLSYVIKRGDAYMIPEGLLIVRRHGKSIRPLFLRPDDETVAMVRLVMNTVSNGVGKRRGEIESAVNELEQRVDFDYRHVRGILELVLRRCVFETEAQLPPATVRETVFRTASRIGIPTTYEERERILDEVAREMSVPVEIIESSLYADLEERSVLKQYDPQDPEELIHYYNLSACQTLLFRATEMLVQASGNWRQILSVTKRLGLMYEVEQHDGNYILRVNGPVSLFRLSHRYGTRLARLLPLIVATEQWRVRAQIRDRNEQSRLLTFEIKSEDGQELFGRREVPHVTYDSSVEAELAQSLPAAMMGWRLTREPAPLPAGQRVMIPDFLLEKAHIRIYLEIAGFWTQDYIRRKLDQIRSLKDVDMILVVDESHTCQELAELEEDIHIIYYRDRVPIRPIINYLKRREREVAQQQSTQLGTIEILPEGPISTITQLASQLGVMEEPLREELTRRPVSGYRLVGNLLISESEIERLRLEIESILDEGESTLATISSLLQAQGIEDPIGVIEALGFRVIWHGLDPSDCTVIRTTDTSA